MAAAAAGGFLSNSLYRGGGEPSDTDAVRDGFFRAVPVGATATQGQETVIMATGELEPGTEGVFVLDVVTGKFKGEVINRTSRRFFAHYKYDNVLKDLEAETVKNPKFLMVTGLCGTVQGARGFKIGSSIIYIAEVNSGNVVAYALPWEAGAIGAARPLNYPLTPIDKFKFRDTLR